MHRTFEEVAGQHIDGLYHGALFLNAGEEPPAEDLVLWTLTGAFQEFRQIEKGGGSEHWLEGRLVGVFLARGASGSSEDASREDPHTDAFPGGDSSTESSGDGPSGSEPSRGSMKIDPEALFKAAAVMPPAARAAIWLVLLRRWSYDEAARVLATDVDGLKDLLRYRHVLLAALVRRSPERNGTDHDRRH